MRSFKPIMLVEDDYGDVTIIKKALKEIGIRNIMVHLENGEEALEYLRKKENEKPCLIFLDLNMPKMNGIDFLKIVKADEQLKYIPVVVLTTSRDDGDITRCFQLGAASYVVKPVDYKKFVQAIMIIDLYWTLNEMPGTSGGNKELENIVLNIADDS